MKKILFLSLFVALTSFKINGQCLYISSIMADACVSGGACSSSLSPACGCEGMNEIVGLKVGSLPINITNITFNWPNNSWKGIATSSTLTAALTASLQATVLGCGKIIEPPMGIIPANAKVMFILSTNMCVGANSFANLNDTLYVIYQNEGNFQGHFANANSTTSLTPRIIDFTVTGIPSCTGSAAYTPALLTNISGVSFSLAGSYSPAQYDGGSIFYDAIGNYTYANIGCNAPFVPLGITANSVPNYVCVGSAQSVSATVSGGAYSYITWSGGAGSFASPTTTNNTNVYTPSSADIGVITLSSVATRTCGPTTVTVGTTFTMNVAHSPTLTSTPSSATICPSQTAILSITVTNAANTGSVLTTNWSSGATTNSISTTVAGVFNVTVTGQCGSAITNFNVSALSNPTINATASTNTLCSGGSVTLSSTSSTGTYTWNTLSNANQIVVTPTTTTFYQVNTANTCSNVNASITITITPSPTLTLNSNLFNICGTQTASITTSAPSGVTYSWSNGATTSAISTTIAGVYNVTVTNSCGSNAQSATVTIGAAPAITLNSSTNTLCNGQSATVTLSGSTGTINWSTGATTNFINVNGGGVYTATLVNDCGTAINSTTINSVPSPTFNIMPQNSLLCPNQTTTLSADATPLTYSLTWYGPGIVGANNFNTITVNTSGTYTLTVTDAVTGCSSSSIVSVTSGSTNAYFIPDITIGNPPLNVNFNNQSTGANTYSWSLGNGSASTNTNTSSTYNSVGVYTVTLFAGANGQCVSQYTVEIIVKDGLGLIPQLVTANGDTKNDFFEIKGLYENYPNNKLEIFNRWGNIVYSSEPYINDWNGLPNTQGKTGSNKLPAGTYYFILQLNDANLTSFKGFIQLEY